MSGDVEIVCLLSHWLKAMVGGDSPIHDSPETEKHCPMCREKNK